MTGILMTRDFFLAWGTGWAIDEADFVLGLYSYDSEIRRCPIVQNDKIVGLLEHVMQLEAVDWLW